MNLIEGVTASSPKIREDAVRCCLFAAVLVLCGVVMAPAAMAQRQEVFAYRIEHETWGDIGTFSNTIRRANSKTEVEARLRIAVTILFGSLVLYREHAERREIWENDRLTTYRSTTNVDGEIVQISGRADGAEFVIRRPDGEVSAPSDVFPTNLWSIEMKDAETVMGSKSGVVVPVKVQGGGGRTIKVGGQDLNTRYFKIMPRADPGVVPFPQEGWFDSNGIPVRFAVVKDDDRVVFKMINYQDVLAGRNTEQ